MGFWLFLFCCNCLIPLLMLVIGAVFQKHPPKKVNPLLGYRTRRSMASQDAWDLAQVTLGRLWWRWGWGLLGFSVLVQLPLVHAGEDQLSLYSGLLCGAQVLVLLLSIPPVERCLKGRFPDEPKKH